ncbi:hypothetical protein [Methylomonas albis]|jgi:hypothetical protein|uniref:Uncharacterized protein n=1 Tax=Methylomonas albis TaxID=1854563 RepID=A0ABR9D5P9_9GAMM|nr:hypothetical protein [Methylomonas albis]MBD9358441.1 hypothetical protein [Methylomonas albis]
MFEAIVLFILSGLVAACAYSSQGCGLSFFGKLFRSGKGQTPATLTSQADGAAPTSSFLEQLQSEIEATLFPRPTDSVLRRHYDALVAVEVKNRLSFFS